jgi:hypothetical protein
MAIAEPSSALRERSDGWQYSIELFREDGEGAGVEAVLSHYQSLPVARAQFKATIQEHPKRLVMLRDRARVLARSDRSDAVSH